MPAVSIFARNMAILLLLRRRRMRKPEREHWVHPVNQDRPVFGEFHHLYTQLRDYPKRFKGYLRLSVEQFDELLDRVDVYIRKKNTHWRTAVSSEQRLAVTLR